MTKYYFSCIILISCMVSVGSAVYSHTFVLLLLLLLLLLLHDPWAACWFIRFVHPDGRRSIALNHHRHRCCRRRRRRRRRHHRRRIRLHSTQQQQSPTARCLLLYDMLRQNAKIHLFPRVPCVSMSVCVRVCGRARTPAITIGK